MRGILKGKLFIRLGS